MAVKRMFSNKISDSDFFIEMGASAQALYFHLNQGADDDGFNNQVSLAMFRAHASMDDLKVLLTKQFIIRFESGVIVIRHWRLHNTLRKDRYVPTDFQEEFNLLGIDEKGAYQLKGKGWLPNGCQLVSTDLDIEVSHISRACAREEEAKNIDNTGLEDFLKAYPNVRKDLSVKLESGGYNWTALNLAFKESDWLQSVDSLQWIVNNYEKILSGKYKNFKARKTSHFASERNYSSEETDKLLSDIERLEF